MSRAAARVYLRGAYGPSNLGDDILLVASLAAVEPVVGRAGVVAGVEWPERLARLAPGLHGLDPAAPAAARVLVYGGGGQFFGFDRPGGLAARIGRLLRGETRLGEALGRWLVRRTGRVPQGPVEARLRAGIGLGIGPFTPGSTAETIARRTLEACVYLSVRDPASLEQCRAWGLGQARLGADLSLDRTLWWTGAEPVGPGPGDAVAFIPRHWPWTEAGSRAVGRMAEAAARLKARGIRVVFVSLDAAGDRPLIASLPGIPWLTWDPMADSPAGFLRRIGQSAGAVVSARAHGLLLAGVIGLPAIGVRVERKLEAVHAMLPTGSRLWSAPFAVDELLAEAEQALAERAERARRLAVEVEAQAERLRQDLAAFRAWLARALVA